MTGKNLDMAQHTAKEPGRERRSAVKIMAQLIGLIRPLLHIMLLAIILGTAGYLCAIFLTILAGQVLLHGLAASWNVDSFGGLAFVGQTYLFQNMSIKGIFVLMVVLAVLRGLLHYVEQYCNHLW